MRIQRSRLPARRTSTLPAHTGLPGGRWLVERAPRADHDIQTTGGDSTANVNNSVGSATTCVGATVRALGLINTGARNHLYLSCWSRLSVRWCTAAPATPLTRARMKLISQAAKLLINFHRLPNCRGRTLPANQNVYCQTNALGAPASAWGMDFLNVGKKATATTSAPANPIKQPKHAYSRSA